MRALRRIARAHDLLILEDCCQAIGGSYGTPDGWDDLRERLGAAGREHAQSSPWSDNARRVLELYRSARGERPA